MKTQTDDRRPPPKPGEPKKAPRPRVVKLEGRIAPALTSNHSETVVRAPAGADRKGGPKAKLQVVKLEGRVAPRIALNHSETVVREAAKAPAADAKKGSRLQVVKLESRIAPRIALNHNQTLVRDRARAAKPATAHR